MIQLLKRGYKRTILAYKSRYFEGEVRQILYILNTPHLILSKKIPYTYLYNTHCDPNY
jgi:hypothetical protein